MNAPAAGGIRIEALDGLRGVAILAVMGYHMTVLPGRSPIDELFVLRVSSAGWWGVELFFVLSGFLITGILLDTRGQPGQLRNFWARRALRILPLYYAVLLVSLVVLPQLDHAKLERFARIRGDELWYWLHLQNFAIALHGIRHGILDVTWSLAIEMQFYLLWPFAVAVLAPRRLMHACVALLATSIAWRAWLLAAGTTPTEIYLLTPGRIDGLVLGAMVAAAYRCDQVWVRRLLGGPAFWASLAGVLVIHVFSDPEVSSEFAWSRPAWQSVGFTLLALAFAGLLSRTVEPGRDGPARRVLEHPVLRSFGKYSFAMYLFHLPLRAFIRDRVYSPEQFATLFGSQLPGQVIFFALALTLTYGAAWLSWHAYERHFLALGRFFPYRGAARRLPAPPFPAP
jgi:peptidoglycan/LPS O-acetylase OafA/YrhL